MSVELKQTVSKHVDQLLSYHAAIAKRMAERDEEIARANQSCAEANQEAEGYFEQLKATIETFCTEHRGELFGEKKTLEINGVKLVFEFGKPLIEATNGKAVNEELLLQAVIDQSGSTLHTAAERQMLSKCYELKASLKKNEIKKLPEALQACLNIVIRQTENFMLRLPKPE